VTPDRRSPAPLEYGPWPLLILIMIFLAFIGWTLTHGVSLDAAVAAIITVGSVAGGLLGFRAIRSRAAESEADVPDRDPATPTGKHQ